MDLWKEHYHSGGNWDAVAIETRIIIHQGNPEEIAFIIVVG
jgi:hypothetical protein